MALAYSCSAASTCARTNLLSPQGRLSSKGERASRVRRPSSLSAYFSASTIAIVRAQQSEPQPEPPAGRFDVSSNCVQPFFRLIPSTQNLSVENKVKILFLSESNICRSVYAEAILNSLIKEKDLHDVIQCSSKGTRDYSVGEKPDARVLEVAEDLGLEIKDHIARIWDCANDVVMYDLILVMDKFIAADALKDITVYETIDKNNNYSWKVRRLGEFCLQRKIEDVDDPLYGNIGGEKELEELHRVALDIRESCNGLIHFCSEVISNVQESETFQQAIARAMGHMAPIEWLKPPMLQRS